MNILRLFIHKPIILVFCITTSLLAKPLITNNIGGGRLGDQLLVYIKAKWFAYFYNGYFRLTPFKGLENFALSVDEIYLKPSSVRSILLDNEKPLSLSHHHRNTLYSAHLHSKDSAWNHWYDHTTWNGLIDSPEFKSEIRRMLKPTYDVPLIPLPTDRITVALHVRKGGGFDKPTLSPTLATSDRDYIPYADLAAPLKFAPDSFYIATLRILSAMLDHAPLYIYLFTDDQNPENIVRAYTKALNMPNITFDYRQAENGPDQHVVDDMINISRFTCLIRPESSFSKIADIIGNHRIIIFPHTRQWVGTTLKITEATIINDGIRGIVHL